MSEPRDLPSSKLHVGLKAEFEREITREDVDAFAQLSGDSNPLHVDADYAATTNYQRPIVHGAFQIALASAMAGMYLPGRRVVLGSARGHFPSPLHYPCKVLVRGEIVSWFSAAQSGMLRVRVQDSASSTLTAEIHMAFTLHEQRGTRTEASIPAPEGQSSRECVVVTGAAGAIGQALMAHLSQRFDVLGLVRRGSGSAQQETEGMAAGGQILQVDLEQDDWETPASVALGGRPLYGLVHAAWPGAPKGGLLEVELDTVRRQLEFGGPLTIRLARWLAAHCAERGRLIVMGSTAGTLHPELALASYSLGKALLEHTVRLLAPELARSAITVNAVLPSYMSVGINRAKTERATLIEAARVPMGRVCTPDDLSAAVDYLLSDAASFLTGQLLPLTGGRL